MPKVTAVENIEESFKSTRMKAYGIAQDQLDLIQGYQDNLNTNPTNAQHLKVFIDHVAEAKKMFKTFFGSEHFKDPAEAVNIPQE